MSVARYTLPTKSNSTACRGRHCRQSWTCSTRSTLSKASVFCRMFFCPNVERLCRIRQNRPCRIRLRRQCVRGLTVLKSQLETLFLLDQIVQQNWELPSPLPKLRICGALEIRNEVCVTSAISSQLSASYLYLSAKVLVEKMVPSYTPRTVSAISHRRLQLMT